MIAAPTARAARDARRRALALPRWIVHERILAIVSVAALACLLRLPLPDLTPFGHDEALEAIRARPIWFGARPVESEVTSWWIPDPAGLLYFFALAEGFARPAVARVVLVALANVAAVLVTYGLARRFFGPTAALVAGLLYAANPWAATFGRQPWVITQPLLTALMLFAAMMVVVGRDRRWIVPFFLAGAAQTQTHLLAVLYGPPVLLTLALFWRRWLGPHLVPAVAAGLLIVAPYGLHLWSIGDDVAAALARGNRGVSLIPDPAALVQTLWLVSGLRLDRKLGVPDPAMETLHGPLLLVGGAAAVLLLSGIALAILACLRRRVGWEAQALLLIWFLGPLALMTWQSSQIYIHYVLVLIPAVFLLMALPLSALWSRPNAPSDGYPTGVLMTVQDVDRGSIGNLLVILSAAKDLRTRQLRRSFAALRMTKMTRMSLPPRRGAIMVVGVVAAILIVHAAMVGAFYAAVDRSASAPRSAITPSELQATLNRQELANKQAGIGELHGLPLRYWQSVADRTRDAARSAGVRDVVVITGIQDSANRHLDRRRKALDYLLGPDFAPRFPLEGLTVLPSGGDAVVLTIPEQDLPRVAARDAIRVVDEPLPGTNGATRGWLVRPRDPRELVSPRMRADVPFASGVRLLGIDLPPRAQAGQSLPTLTYWLVEREAAPDGEDDEPFVELRDADGIPRATARRGGLPSREWRRGDVLIQRSSITVPVALGPGDYDVGVGLASRAGGRVPTDEPAARDAFPAARLTVRPNP